MEIKLNEPLNSWVKSKINAALDTNIAFNVKLAVADPAGVKDVEIKLDLVWFLLIYIDEPNDIKLQAVLELLKQPAVLGNFKQTLDDPTVKRAIAEYLLFNFKYFDALKNYIDFVKLDVPVDFISHALFINRGQTESIAQQDQIRANYVNAVLDAGFILPINASARNQGAVINKVVLMEHYSEKFNLALRLLNAGFKLFNSAQGTNTEVAVELINNRNNPDCAQIIQQNANDFKNLTMHVAGANGDNSNLVDYYYWVKEDLPTVDYLKQTFNLQLSPTS